MMIRTRVAVWFGLWTAVLLVAFGIVVFLATRQAALSDIEADIEGRSENLAAGLAAAWPRAEAVDPEAFAGDDVFVEVTEADGTLVGRSSNAPDSPVGPTMTVDGEMVEIEIEESPFYVYSTGVAVDGRVVGRATIGRSPVRLYQTLGSLRDVLVLALLVGVTTSVAGAWLLARRAMRPLDRLVTAAESITETQDPTQRVGPVARRDEVGRLTESIDGMLVSLEAAGGELRDVNTAQRRFLADVSHQLRAPLTIMRSSADLLRRAGDLDPEWRSQTLDDLVDEVDRMSRMVTQLLRMARDDADAKISFQQTPIGEVAGSACRTWALANRDIDLRWDGLSPVKDTMVEANPDLLREVFDVLLENAFDHTPPGGRIEVSGLVDDDRVRITVADTGVGISEAVLERVFERFYAKGDDPTPSGSGGAELDGTAAHQIGSRRTGLGLAIAQHTAQQHGGVVEAASEPGNGSRFTVVLPAARPT